MGEYEGRAVFLYDRGVASSDSASPLKEIAQWLNNPDSYQFELPVSEEGR